MYKTEDSTGKFCSRTCYYESRNIMAICKNCGKDFKKRVKDPRLTCSQECYKARKSLKSRDDSVRELARVINSKIAGQISIETPTTPGEITADKTPSCCKYEISWLDKIKHFICGLFYKN